MSENEIPESHLVTKNDTNTMLQFGRSALRQARESRETLTPLTQEVLSSRAGSLAGDLVSSTSYFVPSIAKFIGWSIESPEFASLATQYIKEVVSAFCDWSTAEMEACLAIVQDVIETCSQCRSTGLRNLKMSTTS